MNLYLAAALIMTTGAITSGSAQAQTQPSPAASTPPCQTEPYSHMDFWLGEWIADYGSSTPGTNRISRILDGCVVFEEFEGGPDANGLIGRSWSTYHAGARQWRQTWVDNQGGYFALVGGRVGEDFILTNSRIVETAPYLRMVYEDIQPDSFTWRWQQSPDAGQTWTDKWVIHYRRKSAP